MIAKLSQSGFWFKKVRIECLKIESSRSRQIEIGIKIQKPFQISNDLDNLMLINY